MRCDSQENPSAELNIHLNNLERCLILAEAEEPLAPGLIYMRDQGQRIRHRLRFKENIEDWKEENICIKLGVGWPP